MDNDLDINKVTAEFVNQNIELFYNVGKDVLKGATDKVRLLLNNSYKNYLFCVTERYSKAKSFFIRHEPTYLYDFYVPMGLTSGKHSIAKASISSISSVSPFAVITGGGGSGKSMLMRHLFLDALLGKEKVPIYLELRELNQSNQSLVEFVRETLHANHFTLDETYIEKALKAGHFVLLFDGFDEVRRDRRKDVTAGLLKLVKNYDQNLIVVSSRPDNEFAGWGPFTVFQVASLTLDQACELIQKLSLENELKAKFIKDLRDRLFRTHDSFLSNPLLLSIMLLTYGQSADIPNKLNVFYNQAYEALFQRHDAFKGAFQRDRLCPLDIQDFGKVFSVFSTQTYDKRVFQMSASSALEYLEKSKRILPMEFDINDYLLDAQQAVCLLVEDGLLIQFSHRSFQEYFVAKFISNSSPTVQEKLIRRYAANVGQDSVMHLLHEMNPELVERLFVIPGIERLESFLGVKRRAGLTQYVKYLQSEIFRIEIGGERRLMVFLNGSNRFVNLVSFTLRTCGTVIGWEGFGERDEESDLELQRYAGAGDKVRIVVPSKLTARDPLTQALAQHGRFFSKATLDRVFEVKRALLRKHQSTSESLDRILGS